VIQLALSAFGAAGLVEASITALNHGREWLTIAWTAKGNEQTITEAAKAFLRMLVAIAVAALAYVGAKSNFGKALKIARSMPTGGLPALAAAASGPSRSPAGAHAGPAVGIGPSTGAIGATGAQMTKHTDEGGGSETTEAAKAEEPPTRAERDADPAAKDGPEKKPGANPRKTGGLGNEVAEGQGRGLAEYPVAKSTIEPELIDTDPRALEYLIKGKTLTGKRVDFGSVELELTPQGDPAAPPTMSLGASAFVDGTEYAARIYDEVISVPGGHPVGRGTRISLTRYAMDSFERFYQGRFHYPLKA
jgi:hypothetical protein